MLKDYLLDRLPKVRVLDVHDDPMHERLRVRLVPGGRQPIDHAYSFRRCLDEVPKTHTERVTQASYSAMTSGYREHLVWTGVGSHHPYWFG